MLDQNKLIELLNGPGVKSGTALGGALGVSRMAVQKRIQSLAENGLPVVAVPSKGYELEAGVSLLNESDIRAASDVNLIESLEVFQSINSTNSYLLQQSVLNQRARVCVAESQEAGRGRRGNEWLSKPYRNIMLSLSWGFSHWPETITGLGLAVALIVAERLNKDFDLGVQIKWPNDLMVADDKLAGILIDVAGESSGECHVVVGLGLNVHQPDWSDAGDYRWVDLASLGVQCDRSALVGAIIGDLVEMLKVFESGGFSPLVDRWNALSSYTDRRVRVGGADDWLEGVMQGVDESGALLIKTHEGRLVRFSDSSVSVRLLS